MLIDTEISLMNFDIIKDLNLENMCIKIPRLNLVGANKKINSNVNKVIMGEVEFINKEVL